MTALGLAFLWAGCTIAEARGRGLYSAVVSARIDWARQRGLQLVGLYALTTTSSPVVAKQGFTRHGGLTHWERAPIRAKSEG
jgi:GNAT superfamily N-acetyltransferase